MDFSVAILCYNYGRYLGAAIDSVLSQELRNGDKLVQVLVVDDGSTDETASVCAGYAGQIHVVRSPENRGFGATLSACISESVGEVVCLLDADDMFAPGKLRALGNAFDSGVDFVQHEQRILGGGGEVVSGGNTSTIAVRRTVALTLLPIENEVALHAIRIAGGGRKLSAPLTVYRLHADSMTDRRRVGVQNDYLAGVHHRLALRWENPDARPPWAGDRGGRVWSNYVALANYNRLESSLERRQRADALINCCRFIAAALRSRQWSVGFLLKMTVKALRLRPSFPKSTP